MEKHYKKLRLYYKGLNIYATKGIHEKYINIINKYIKKGNHILDIACGSGAFAVRLIDNGYRNVHVNDIDSSEMKIDNVVKTSVDLNKEINNVSFLRKYDCIVAIDVIEHLENPFKFLRDANKILVNNGMLLISTPNITNLISRWMFLRKGHWYSHNPINFNLISHKLIIPHWLIIIAAEREHFNLIHHCYAGD